MIIDWSEWEDDLQACEPILRPAFIINSLRNKKNLHIFGRYFFPHIIKGYDPVPECHIDLTCELGRRGDGGIIFPRGYAKAQPLDCKVLTPKGWNTIGALREGDLVIGWDGKPTRVTRLHPISRMGVFEIETRDGRRTRCNEEHLWSVYCPSNWENKRRVISLKEMLANYRAPRVDKRDGRKSFECRYFLPTHAPVELESKKLPIDPYMLGVWLGDGTSENGGITSIEADAQYYATRFPLPLHKQGAKYRYNIVGLKPMLRQLGLLKNKHIPEEYLFGSIEQRLAILRGLLDTDGSVSSSSYGRIAEFSNQNERLTQGVAHLARSLGGRATISRGVNRQHGREIPYAKVLLHMPDGCNPFSLPRKADRWRPARSMRVAITSIKRVAEQDCRCITVENPDGLYVTDDFIVTHNSTWEKIDTIHDIVYLIEDVILYIAASKGDAMPHVESIKAELENNELLQAIYGYLVPANNAPSRKWTSTHIETANGVNLVARGRNKGRGVNIKNKRPTKIIVDDAEDDEMVRNPDRRAQFHDWLYNVIFPSLDAERGFIKMIGTNIHEMCEVNAFYKKHGGIFRRAMENGKSIWPSRFTEQKIEEIKRKIGTRAFNREYMNNPTSDDEAKIRREWIEKGYYVMLDPQFTYEAVIYIDPQAGLSQKADEYALSCVYRQKGGMHRYVVEQMAGRISQMDQAREVVRMWLRHKRITRLVGVEKVLNQTAVYQTLLDWKAKKINLNPPDAVQGDPDWIDESDRNMPLTAHSPNGKDKVARLEMFEPDFERGEIHLRQEMEELAHQLMFTVGSGKEHDDRADSLVGALELVGRETKKTPKDDALGDAKKTRYNETITGNLMDQSW